MGLRIVGLRIVSRKLKGSVGANTIIMEIIHKEKLNNTCEYY